MRLGSRVLEDTSEPYVIAEIGVNHEGSLDLAKELIEQAAAGGADAAKFQTYKAQRLASENSPAYWDTTKEPTRSQFELFGKYDVFDAAEYVALAEHCASVGVDFLSTPFDLEAVDMLDPLMPFFKVASADITNIPLLRRVASKGKAVVLSTGASTVAEIDQAVVELSRHGAAEIVLMHCVLSYPTSDDSAHLRMIKGLQHSFPGYLIGYSDHTTPTPELDSLLVAYLQGALVLEKHFTHDKTLPGNDHYHAMDAADVARFRQRVRHVLQLLGPEEAKHPVAAEMPAREHARRSIVADRPMVAGTVLGEDDVVCKRPAHGIPASQWDDVVGSTLRADVAADQILRWTDLRG